MNEFHSWTQKSPPVIGVAAHDQMFYFASGLSETKINYGHINNIFTKVLFSAVTCVMGKLLYRQVTDETWVMISPAAFFHPEILYLPLNINFWLVFNKQVNTLRSSYHVLILTLEVMRKMFQTLVYLSSIRLFKETLFIFGFKLL